MSAFLEVIRLIQDGEFVTAGVANRSATQLDGNIRYLHELMQAAMLSETLFARRRVVEADAAVGMPVYFNPQTQQFERALAVAELGDDGLFHMAPSAYAWGVVYLKHTATSADILLHGTAEVSLAAAVASPVVTGALYGLSNTTPGQLVTGTQPVGVSVLQVAGPGSAVGTHTVYVNTKFNELLEGHRHYKFSLSPLPAGDHTPPSVGASHTITDPDENVEGWLPASHAVFNGLAPAGAAFGYNLSASPLQTVWPPSPLESAYLEMNRGQDQALLNMGVPLGPEQLCVIDQNGIWWMSDCYDDVPWPVAYNSALPPSVDDAAIECPRMLFPQMTLWFSRPTFATNGGWVASLRAAENSGLTVTCVDNGEPATTGHLQIDLDLALQLQDQNAVGHQVVKTLSTDGRLVRGPVVESLKAGTPNVTLTSNTTVGVDGKTYGQIVLSVDQGAAGYELPIDTVRLDGVEEEFYRDVIGLGFPAGRRSEFRGRLNLATGSVPVGTQLKLRFWFLNRTATNVPANLFTVTTRRLAAPSAAGVAVTLPISDTALGTYPTALVNVGGAADRYFYIETAAFAVTAGDIVLFSLRRSGNTDGFNADLHLLRQHGVYVLP